VLGEAGVEKSGLLVAVTNTDEVNLVACLAAKAQGVPRTMARIHNADYHAPEDRSPGTGWA
jgi:trk system potassium uptake protein